MMRKFLAGSVMAFALLSFSVPAHAATTASIQAQIDALLAQLARLQGEAAATAAVSTSGMRIVLEAGTSGASYARVYGLSDAIRKGLITGAYRMDVRAVASDGTKYLINGNFEDGSAIADGARMVFFFSKANPNFANQTFAPGNYTLDLVIYRLDRGTPSYVLNSVQVAEIVSDSFSYPFSSAVATPSCTLSAAPASTTLNKSVTVSWMSQNAKKLEWVKDTSGKDNLKVPSSKPKASGSRSFKMTVLGNPSLTMKVTNASGASATCSVIIPVAAK